MKTNPKANERVSFESKSVCLLECFRQYPADEILGPAIATGFYWSEGAQLFLITNWHCVTGLNANDCKPNGTFTPTHMKVKSLEVIGDAEVGSKTVKYVTRTVSLYDEEDTPTWRQHPLGREVDVVAIPMDIDDWKSRIFTVNMKQQIESFQPMCGDDCYIVGYPEGFEGPIGTPIWKRASIATEPELNYGQKPLFLADSLTRCGMSGSPVYARIAGLWGQEGLALSIDPREPKILGSWTKFIGVYAGREGDEKKGFQLARVWKASVLQEIIEHLVVPPNPHL